MTLNQHAAFFTQVNLGIPSHYLSSKVFLIFLKSINSYPLHLQQCCLRLAAERFEHLDL